MKNIVFILGMIIGVSASFTTAAQAETYSFARTTANELNVRDMPNGKDVIKRLPLGSVVAILQSQGIWTNVLYLENEDPSKPKQGWVSNEYLRVLYSKDMDIKTDTRTAGI